MRKKLVAIEKKRIKTMEQLTTKRVEENNSIQREKKQTFKTISYENIIM